MSRWVLCPFLLVFAFVGCVERKIFIRSEPPGASVFMDGEKIGTTPTEVPFTFYGTREIVLEKEDYKTIKAKMDLNTPLYQFFPFDFLFDVVLPLKIKDIKKFDYVLEKQPSDINGDEIFRRAKELKEHLK